MISLFEKYTRKKKILILGFGREGQSTFRFIKKYFPGLTIGIADQNEALSKKVFIGVRDEHLFIGENYLAAIRDFEVIIKSPGIKLTDDVAKDASKIWLSQTGLFLEQYHRQIIGITGTKGKSTTSGLIHHIMKIAGKKSILVGNIGQPPFDLIHQIDDETIIVFELSAHQLQHVHHSPHIAILLNLFQEHLDYFGKVDKYFDAKMNIAKFQIPEDVLIYNSENKNILHQLRQLQQSAERIPFPSLQNGNLYELSPPFLSLLLTTNCSLKGLHNVKNIVAAAISCFRAGIFEADIIEGVKTFVPLEHRLEFLGSYCGIDFYNDSISTIPESTIEAVKTIKNIYTLILGGFDRGVDYRAMLHFLAESQVVKLIFTGPAGRRMMEEYRGMKKTGQQMIFIQHFDNMQEILMQTKKGMACVLSPAASSYDQFKDFEERGRCFKKMAESLNASCH